MADISAVYAQYCLACHGTTGAGDGPAAAGLPDPKPAKLSETKLDDTGLKAIISGGGASVGRSPIMAAFGPSLSAEQITQLVSYIRGLKK